MIRVWTCVLVWFHQPSSTATVIISLVYLSPGVLSVSMGLFLAANSVCWYQHFLSWGLSSLVLFHFSPALPVVTYSAQKSIRCLFQSFQPPLTVFISKWSLLRSYRIACVWNSLQNSEASFLTTRCSLWFTKKLFLNCSSRLTVWVLCPAGGPRLLFEDYHVHAG